MGVNRNRVLESDIIQGGMGAGVSDYKLARNVALLNDTRKGKYLGVISGTALDTILLRRLQDGDSDGKMRWALSQYPDKNYAEQIIDRYFIEGGKASEASYDGIFPTYSQDGKDIKIKDNDLERLIVLANFAEVTLAKEGHDYPIGINYLHKISWPLLPSLYGAILAGVDAALIGAGIFRDGHEVIESLSRRERASMTFTVKDGEGYNMVFDPNDVYVNDSGLEKPVFLGIVSNDLGVRGLPNVDGYIIEGDIAGGHNAPPRSDKKRPALTESGEPNYGPKDENNLDRMKSILSKRAVERGSEQPFWFAGGYAARLKEARKMGARGIQVGTPFAFCSDSGIESGLRARMIDEIVNGEPRVFTDPLASPSGFPFKVLQCSGTIAEVGAYENRQRECNLGYLFEFFDNEGVVRTRCPAEKVDAYLVKGGKEDNTRGRKCICNALLSTIGHPNTTKDKSLELPIVTTGSDLNPVIEIVNEVGKVYNENDVVEYIEKKASED